MKVFKVVATVEKEVTTYIHADKESDIPVILEDDDLKRSMGVAIVHDPDAIGISVETIEEVKWNEQTSRETSR